MRYLLISVLTLSFLMVLGNACSNTGGMGGLALNSSNSTAANLAQSPLISCSVINMANNQQIMHVSNLTQASNFSLPPSAPATVDIDCSQSTSSSGGPVSIAISQGNGAYVPLSGSVFSQMYAQSGVNLISIKAVDASGNSSIATFKLPVSCNPSSVAPISFNIAGMQISGGASGGPGYVNVNLPGASGGGGGPYNYAIDLNGDGRFDDFQQQYWNSTTSFNNMYTLYNGVRNVSVTVFDTACELEKTFTTPINFSSILPAAQSGATAQQESYYYLQGNVSSLSNSTDPADTVHPFDAMESATVNPPQHVLCSYSDGQFNITGENTYSDGNTSSSESLLKQSMELDWTISDNGSAGILNVSNVPITKLAYETAASPDGSYNQYVYNKDASCLANITVIRQTGVTPCTGGQTGTVSPATTILGTFSCGHLSAPAVQPDPNGRAVSINDGYFYCQVAPQNNCVGGGGQGGGGVPPPQF